MISTKCYQPIKGVVLRTILLDSCGAPVTGNSVVTHSAFTSVTPTAQYETGERYLDKTADGLLCGNDKDPDILTHFELAIALCSINPGLVANTVSPARLLTYSESPTGTGFAIAEGAATTHFSLEVWQRVRGTQACASGTPQYVYNAWPHLTDGKLGGDYLIGVAPSTLTIQANSLPVNIGWTAGTPWLGAGAIQVIQDHWFQNLTTVAPPTAVCSIQDYTAP
jgi:hypothetical protein